MGFQGVNYEHFMNMARNFMNIGDLFNFCVDAVIGYESTSDIGL